MDLCRVRLSNGRVVYYLPRNPPCPDSEELAAQWMRVLLAHRRGGLEIKVAPVGELSCGWVIGTVSQ